MALTDVAIRSSKPTNALQKLSDGEGLQLWIQPSGSKLWRMAYRFDGKQKSLAFGTYPELGLSDARKKRDEAKALLVSGIDPSQQKRLDKITKAISNATTFKVIAEEFLDKQAREGRANRTLAKNRWLLEFTYPLLGARPIADIKAQEVLAVLKRLEARGTLETARRVRANAGAVFRYAIATGRAENDPTIALKGAIIAPKVTHRAAITDAVAFGGLLRAIEAFDGQPTTKAALRLLPLVFTRPSELRLAQWDEFDLDKAIWIIPAKRTKMRREHQVPLAHQALAILKDLHPITGQGALVFPGIRTAQRPISENTLNAAMRRMGYDKEEVTAHGFRATASTLLNESGKFSPDSIERALAHQDPDAVRRAYARGSFWKERVDMAQWWADHLDTLRKGGEVVELKRIQKD